LLPFGKETFLEHIAGVLDGEADPVIVVLGHHADEIERELRLPPSATILRNPGYQQGQLSSLHIALRYLADCTVSAALVCLVDHPGLTKPVVRALLETWSQLPSGIVIPTWQGRRGHPVLFSSKLFSELLAAPLDQGARVVVKAHAQEVKEVPVEEQGVTWDIDRPEDYAALLERWRVSSGAD
jgi:molybdenum cofactor cytidylyltransferase